MLLGITFLSHNDNFTLFYSLKQFFKNTNIIDRQPFNIYILCQQCSPSYRRSIESLVKWIKTTYKLDKKNQKTLFMYFISKMIGYFI